MAQHTPGAGRAAKRIARRLHFTTEGPQLSPAERDNATIIDQEVTTPLQAHIDRLEAEKAELVGSLKEIIAELHPYPKIGYSVAIETIAQAAIAKTETTTNPKLEE